MGTRKRQLSAPMGNPTLLLLIGGALSAPPPTIGIDNHLAPINHSLLEPYNSDKLPPI